MSRITDHVNAPQQGGHDGFDDSDLAFSPATREKIKARLALMGVSGAGKTWTGLQITRGFDERFAVIDTERGSASKYAGIHGVQFDTLQLRRFDPRQLIKALAAAAAAGYGAVLIDSLTHFWNGADGTLEQVDRAAKKGYSGNTFAGWSEGTPLQNAMVDALLSYPGHIVATMRARTEWSLETNERGKREPVRLGTRPEQRKGVEYEFDVVGQMDTDNTLTIIKSRCPDLHNAVIEKPDGRAIAATMLGWLNDGAAGIDPANYVDRATDEKATFDDLRTLRDEVESRGLQATPMIAPDGTATVLGDYITARGIALQATVD
ncbi:ATP-binding protein [Streptomyces sp. NPDC056242]|uniref:ATP-binding protein n=1 Tax=Streptomyces sp. NPDC056242 TaxID=3345760 RepID=UPI0035E10952